MAIQIDNPDHRSRLAKSIRKSFTDGVTERRVRSNLVKIYDDIDEYLDFYNDTDTDLGTLLNLFQKYVKGHLLSLAHYAPRWDINSRTQEGRGFDKRIQSFLNSYSEILNLHSVQQQLALDSAFGWAVCKIDNGIAPKGITAPVAPRLYRIDPDMLIVDRSAATFEECSFIGDMYLVPLNEVQAYEGFDEEARMKVNEYKFSLSSTTGSSSNPNLSDEVFAEPMVRLIDVYIEKAGAIFTWNCPNDDFNEITQAPLGVRSSNINPYEVLSLLNSPGKLIQISRLGALRGLHLVANEMLYKGVQQARASQRNPTAPLGSEQDLENALNAGDNNPIYLEDKSELGLFTIPGPDSSILNLASATAGLFSQEAGNLEVALGASTGADTARQTEALLGQISASQSIDRRSFEMFLANIGKKLASLAFENEALEVHSMTKVPGTKYKFSRVWSGTMPRVGVIDSYHFDVAQFSTAFRTPQERLGQLQQASQLIMQWMMAKAQGAPVNLPAIIESTGQAFDLVPELMEWWNGQEPSPAEKTSDTYTSLAAGPEGSDVRYHGNEGGGGPAFSDSAEQGGVE